MNELGNKSTILHPKPAEHSGACASGSKKVPDAIGTRSGDEGSARQIKDSPGIVLVVILPFVFPRTRHFWTMVLNEALVV